MQSVLVKTISADKELCIAMQYAHNSYFFQICFEIFYLNFTAFQLAVYCNKLLCMKQTECFDIQVEFTSVDLLPK